MDTTDTEVMETNAIEDNLLEHEENPKPVCDTVKERESPVLVSDESQEKLPVMEKEEKHDDEESDKEITNPEDVNTTSDSRNDTDELLGTVVDEQVTDSTLMDTSRENDQHKEEELVGTPDHEVMDEQVTSPNEDTTLEAQGNEGEVTPGGPRPPQSSSDPQLSVSSADLSLTETEDNFKRKSFDHQLKVRGVHC